MSRIDLASDKRLVDVCSLRYTNQLGGVISLPLGKALLCCERYTKKIPISEAPHVLVPLAPKWFTHLSRGEALAPAVNDYRDIMRLSAPLRKLVNKELLQNHSDTELNWVNNLSANTRTLVDKYLQPHFADNCRAGWIYIYIDDELWREVKSDGEGGYKDVDLKAVREQEQRAASGESIKQLCVPYKTNNKRCKIEMAFSEVQWSWPRVLQLRASKTLSLIHI